MSNFWIQLAKNGMPVGVIKREFYPSELGFGWENFGRLGELSEAKAALTERDKRIKELEQAVVKIGNWVQGCDCFHTSQRKCAMCIVRETLKGVVP